VLNYAHKNGTNPLLAARELTYLGPPLLDSVTLGAGEQTTIGAGGSWGHLAPAALALLKPYEVRFYGRTGTNATRLLHFKTWAKSVVSYFTTGQGSINMIGLRFMRTLLANHTGSLTSGAVAGGANRGALAMTDRPFNAAGAHWSIRDSSGYWRADEASLGAMDASKDTLHQIWIRQAPPPPELLQRTDYIANSDVSATLVTNGPPIVSGAIAKEANAKPNSVARITLDFPFYVFGADVFDRMAFTTEAYLAFAFDPATGADSVTTNVTATPVGPSLHFGSADRTIKALTLNAPVLVFGLTAQTAVLVYDPWTYSSGSFMKYEITFARDGTSQYIEIRAGPTVSFGPTTGTWMLTNGIDYNITFPVVKAGYSTVLQTDAKGMKWTAYPNTNLKRTFSSSWVAARRCV